MNEYSSPYFLHERVSQDELRTAYDAAKARGQDYLLWVMFTKVAEGPRVSGYSNVSVHEALLEAREGSVAIDIQSFMDPELSRVPRQVLRFPAGIFLPEIGSEASPSGVFGRYGQKRFQTHY